jgi:succinate dehydrogenase / fumarate reductase cytochrome b subunit
VSTALAYASAEASSTRTPFLIRRLHSLTGLVFGGYIVVHLLVNATLIQGGKGEHDVFQLQVDKIHSLPFLLAIETIFIFLPLLFHTVYGIYLAINGSPNNANYSYGRNWAYLMQRISAMIIVFFALFHILGMKGLLGETLTFIPENAAASTQRHIMSHWTVAYLLYPIGVLASCFHLSNGFYTAAITWGLTVSKAAQKRWGMVCVGVFVFTFACGMLALTAMYSRGQIVIIQ